MADLLLDDEPLDGAYPVHLTVRPHRTAHTVDACDGDALFDRIRILCQEWGGAGAPIIPLDKARLAGQASELALSPRFMLWPTRSSAAGGPSPTP